MIEVLIALFLVSVGILVLITLQPAAIRLSGKSDYLGRASGILAAQLQAMEAKIINPNNTLPAGGSSTVYASGQGAAKQGDVEFTVNTTVTNLAANPPTYRVNVHVTWPGNATGVRESMIVVQQQSFKQ